jgi:hypothetical protein
MVELPGIILVTARGAPPAGPFGYVMQFFAEPAELKPKKTRVKALPACINMHGPP